jgi:nitroimidazol reductase NimA-like FMN-containing flavoprotein (pyridoxamine 5'-phosphate oxidase superfamily)
MSVPWEWAERRLRTARNYWLAVSTERGPYVRPVWCVWHGGVLLFTSSPTSRKARALAADPRVSVHLELVREVVVVEGDAAEADPSADAIAAYSAKYRWLPPESQRWYAVRPVRCYAADEGTFPDSEAVFRFPEEA